VFQELDLYLRILAIGVGATMVMDLWAIVQWRIFGVPVADYGLVGRWIGHMTRFRFCHESIAAARPVKGERVIGWVVHYLTGIAYAALLLAVWGTGWTRDPKLLPALITGLATVAVPFLVMQPAFGLGIAASRTPHPNAARMRSLSAHLSFGLGLYLSGRACLLLLPS
jgi:hypothetical protein